MKVVVVIVAEMMSTPQSHRSSHRRKEKGENSHDQDSGLSTGATYLRSEILSASQSPDPQVREQEAAIRMQKAVRGHQVRKNTDVCYKTGWLSLLLLRVADGIKKHFQKMSRILIQFAEQVTLGRQGYRHLTTLREHYGAKVTVVPVVSADLQQHRARPGNVVITTDKLEQHARNLSGRRQSH